MSEEEIERQLKELKSLHDSIEADLSGHQESFELDDEPEIVEHPMYALKLNEKLQLRDDTCIRRVPGGWVYEYHYTRHPSGLSLAQGNITAVFVPYTGAYKYYDDAK